MKVFRTFQVRIALAALLAAGAASPVATAQIPGVKSPFGGGKPKTGAEPAAETATDQKSAEEFYLDMKEFAEGLYNKPVGEGENRRDSDFKRRVDTEFERLKQANAQRAYEVNLSAHSEVKYVVEDRFRVFSGLYDNLLVQDLLNRTGQSIVPKVADHLYTFKLIADPIPRAETLSTGTIYISTGLIALLDTKAQLAYVLAHEAAHVYRGHFKTEIMINLAAEEYAAKNKANKEIIQQRIALIGAIGGAVIGGATGGGVRGAELGAAIGGIGGYLAGDLVQRSKPMLTDWNRVQEDEADQTALAWVLAANQNIEEIPKVYRVLKDAGDRDDRVTLGFLGRSNRVRERAKRLDEWIALEKGKADYAKRVWVTSDPDFDILLAEVKRDNGILAFQYDMLDTARENLEKAVAIKTTDSTALYFYAKILQETAKTDEDRKKAQDYYRMAAENDKRNLNYGANLHRAVAMLRPDATVAEKQEAVALLKKYLEGYYLSASQATQKQTAYPPHLETVYDYMSRLGDFTYVLDGDQVLRSAAAEKAKLAPAVAVVDPTAPALTPVSTKPTPAKPAATKPTTTKP